MNPTYQKALDAIISSCPSGTTHPNDFARVVHIFKKLTEAGKFTSHPDKIKSYLTQNGLPDSRAEKIQTVYEVFESVHKDNPGWSDTFINEIVSSQM